MSMIDTGLWGKCHIQGIAVDEVKDEKGNKILCAKEFIEDNNNEEILRFNILTSSILARIKRIQQLIEKSGKNYGAPVKSCVYP